MVQYYTKVSHLTLNIYLYVLHSSDKLFYAGLEGKIMNYVQIVALEQVFYVYVDDLIDLRYDMPPGY